MFCANWFMVWLFLYKISAFSHFYFRWQIPTSGLKYITVILLWAIILGIDNEYKLSNIDNGFHIMVWHAAFWIKFCNDPVLDKKSLSS